MKTGLIDDNGTCISFGDTLKSKWEYEVLVIKDDNGEPVGKLICESGHSCENIPYSLNEGRGYTVTKNQSDQLQ